ncbi:hypothetical protein [Cryptosporangium aurantiacum]|uniref:Uncharacterized protein n=1 Tax=Cryptosporangium aurantiacum TaxID=134849 RepID=A0A1M7REN2_9ACTN|nr:hypothetical protein [Cryptosporangium aurantiacum]SHN44641.1 hypothetical protein SAMN05443668_110297 [Cryptosporangium aurantiacum]
MDPVTMLVATLGTQAVRTVLVQGVYTDDGWDAAGATLLTDVLGALLGTEQETEATLQRVEEKLDALKVGRFQLPLQAAIRHLREARQEWRSTQDRGRLLEQARFLLTEACVAAPDGASRATAEWHLALTWLLSGSPRDCWEALTRARDESFGAITTALDEWAAAPLEARRWGKDTDSPAEWTRRVVNSARTVMNTTAGHREARTTIATRIEAAVQVAQTVQSIRAALGAQPASCQRPRLSLDPLPDAGIAPEFAPRPALVLDLLPGVNNVWGTSIHVHAIDSPKQLSRCWWTVDAQVTINPAAPDTRTQILSIADIEDLHRPGEDLRDAPIRHYLPRQLLQPESPARALTAGSQQPAASDRWITSLSRGAPTHLAIRTQFDLVETPLGCEPRGGIFALMPIPPSQGTTRADA